MRRSFSVGIVLLLVTLSFIVSVNAAPVYNPVNGHFYEAVYAPGFNFAESNAAAIASGGYLATITSEEENNFIYDLIKNDDKFWTDTGWGPYMGPWIGGYQLPGSEEPGGGWTWLTSESWIYTNWMDTAPDDCLDYGCGPQSHLHIVRLENGAWNDAREDVTGFSGYIVEYENLITGSLEIKSSPSHAKIYIDGVDTGKFAKWTFDKMAPGEYDVYVMLDGYATPETEHVTVGSEQTAKLHFMLKKDGTPVPEFPSIFPPATMIIGFLGAVLLIRRTREH